MTDTYKIKGLGYLRSLNSHRDYSPQNENVSKIYAKIPKLERVLTKVKATKTNTVDIRD